MLQGAAGVPTVLRSPTTEAASEGAASEGAAVLRLMRQQWRSVLNMLFVTSLPFKPVNAAVVRLHLNFSPHLMQPGGRFSLR